MRLFLVLLITWSNAWSSGISWVTSFLMQGWYMQSCHVQSKSIRVGTSELDHPSNTWLGYMPCYLTLIISLRVPHDMRYLRVCLRYNHDSSPQGSEQLLDVTRSLLIRDLSYKSVQWEHFLVHPLGVALKAPSNFLKLLGVFWLESFC